MIGLEKHSLGEEYNDHVEPRQINQRLADFSLRRGSRASFSSRRFQRDRYIARYL
jgi:hypothetical protein